MKLNTIILILALTFSTIPAFASVDFSNPETTLDKLYEKGESSQESAYEISFDPLLPIEYENPNLFRKFTNYTFEDDVLSTTHYTYTYTPYDFTGFTPTLNRTDLTSYPSTIKSLYDNTELFFVIDTSEVIDWETFDDYHFKIPSIVRGELVETYYKINYIEKAEQTGNIYTGTTPIIASSTTIENHFYNKENGAIQITSAIGIGDVYGDFINNKNGSSSTISAGIGIHILNSVAGNIVGDFINNQFRKETSSGQAFGMAIYSFTSTIESILGNFIGNSIISSTHTGQGGAIFNRGNSTIKNINGDFIGNYIQTSSTAMGGALGNEAIINKLTSNFLGNYTFSQASSLGGAIYNRSVIGEIIGHFIGNYVLSTTAKAQGGAIYATSLTSDIGNITGDFISNTAESEIDDVQGGAIHNMGKIGHIKGDFINNGIIGNRNVEGGAIYILSHPDGIASITGDFINNYAIYTGTLGYTRNKGGAIFIYSSKIGDINGNFIGNFINSTMGATQGGAIYNEEGNIGNIKGDFISNYARSQDSEVFGGAIYTTGDATKKITSLSGTFSGNYAYSEKNNAKGGAIYATGTGEKIGSIRGAFINNYAISYLSGKTSQGGAIYLDKGEITSIYANFIENYIYSTGVSNGGAISLNSNDAKIGTIEGNFINNYAQLSSSSSATGGAIHISLGTINNISGNFKGNHTSALAQAYAYGGAIHLTNNNNKISFLEGVFDGNYASSAVRDARGGAIYTNGILENISASFLNNYVETKGVGRLVVGGAIYANNNLVFSTNGKNIEFTGNYLNNNGTKSYNSIFLDTSTTNDRTISMLANQGGSITFNDEIVGGRVSGQSVLYGNTYKINITGEQDSNGKPTGEVAFNASVINAAQVNVKDAILKLGSYNHGNSSFTNNEGHGLFLPASGTTAMTTLSLNNSVLHLNYDTYQNLKLASIVSTNNSSIIFGANFENGTSDQITATTADASQSINLRAIKIDGAVQMDKEITLFNNKTSGYLDIGNIDSFVLIHNAHKYGLSYDAGTLKIAYDLGDVYPIYIETTTGIDSTTMDGTSNEGVIVNDDVGTVTNSSFNNNSNNGNTHSIAGDGGVILNNKDLMVINSSFESNNAKGNGGVIANNTNGLLSVENSTFSGNAAEGLGGAIYSAEDLSISASDSITSSFNNNTQSNGSANDVYVDNGKTLTLSATSGGALSFNSGIDGNNYKLNVTGSDDGNINLNSQAKNVSSLKLSGATLNVAQNDYLQNLDVELTSGTLNFANNEIGDILFNSLQGGSGLLNINFNPDALTSDLLKISGDFEGNVSLVLNALDTQGNSGFSFGTMNNSSTNDKILFAEVLNDNLNTSGTFSIYRIIGSPYEWFTSFDATTMSWYLALPQNTTPVASAEIIPYLGMMSASLEQTRTLQSSLKHKTAISRPEVTKCVLTYNGRTCDKMRMLQSWVNPVVYNSSQHNPVDMKSEISGLDAGFDLQNDIYNKLGLFLSFRNGEHKFNGRGEKYFSSNSSETNINSYLAGIYYRRDKNNYWLLSSIYGGMQRAKIRTEDNLHAKNNALQLGGDIELGQTYDLAPSWKLSKAIALSYTYLDLNKIEDNYGKQAKYDALHHGEIEASLMLEKYFDLNGNKSLLYFKPSLIQTLTAEDNIYITGLEKTKGYHDRLFGKIEFGGRTYLTNNLSTYGNVSYMGSNKYDAFSATLGLNYNW
ncbi:MAG: hypothetical protein PHE89_07240 [Alphaproteobacteria bacterium]|nr:hypothetical protein [Alphaproteobacteria bacterium]